MDRIISNYLETFKVEQSFPDDLDEPTLFEHFVNYCVVSTEYNERFDLEDVHAGGGGDLGQDGIAIIVNGKLVNSEETVKELANKNTYLDVEFIFTQAKTGNNFDMGELLKFFTGVQDFFDKSDKMSINDKLQEKLTVMDAIYEKAYLFKEGNPLCKMYYATTGKWSNDKELTRTIDKQKSILQESDLFKEVIFVPVDAKDLAKLYMSTKKKICRQIELKNKITLTEIQGVRQAFIGVIPALEYLKLITDDSDNIVRGLFYDNVRDFQGDNDVNKEIKETILSKENHKDFVLYNNGITIVADSIRPTNNIYKIDNYQIVNGCQTSYMLHKNKDAITDNMYITVKLIELENDSIKNNIIKATNNQTQVKPQQLAALTTFQKKLEDYYASFPENKKLYYERRKGQYNELSEIEGVKIVDISKQTQSFASMFLDRAHQASHYSTQLWESLKGKIFLENHDPVGYYVSAYALFRCESFLRKNKIDKKYRHFRYHILAILRLQIPGEEMPKDFASNKFKKYCEKIQKILWDEDECLQAFINATSVIDQVVKGNYAREVARRQTLVKEIKAHL